MLDALNDSDIKSIVNKGFNYLIDKYGDIDFSSDVLDFIVSNARGDARYALNLVENSYFASDLKDEKRSLSLELVESLAQKRNVRYSRQEHYDCASAFQKSLRGSDENAAVYYLAKMIDIIESH